MRMGDPVSQVTGSLGSKPQPSGAGDTSVSSAVEPTCLTAAGTVHDGVAFSSWAACCPSVLITLGRGVFLFSYLPPLSFSFLGSLAALRGFANCLRSPSWSLQGTDGSPAVSDVTASPCLGPWGAGSQTKNCCWSGGRRGQSPPVSGASS